MAGQIANTTHQSDIYRFADALFYLTDSPKTIEIHFTAMSDKK